MLENQSNIGKRYYQTRLLRHPGFLSFGSAKSSRNSPFSPYFNSDLIIRSWRQESTFLKEIGKIIEVQFILKILRGKIFFHQETDI